MKKVDIISKVVARKGEAMASPSKGAAPSVDLSGYLLKEIWDRIFEIRYTENGEEYIFCKTSLAAQGGLTMYVDGGLLDLPSIYDGLPIDGKTLFWEEVIADDGTKSKILKSKGGGGGSIEYPLSWSGFSSGSWDGTTSKTIYIPSKVSELTNDSDYAKTSDLSKYLPLTGGTLTGDLRLKDSTNYGRTIYFGDDEYVYITEDSDDHLTIFANSGIELATDVTVNKNLDVLGSMKVKGTKFQAPAGSDTRGFEFTAQYCYVHWDYVSRERIFHLDGNNVLVFAKVPQVTGNGSLATQPWVKQNYITSIANVQNTEGGATFDRYLGITKNDSTTNLTVGYAVNSRLIKAYSVSDLSTNSAWNTAAGMCCNYFASNASNIPATPGNNANGVISFMTTWNYGFQIGYLNSLSTGYETIPHLYFRNFVNGSYKAWYRIVTNGPQMTFEGINWSNPYMRMRYQSGSWYYVQMRSDGMWLGLSNTNGVRIDASGNLLTTGGVTMYGTSDQRLKHNIRTFDACKELMKLGGVFQFEYIEEEVKRNGKYKGTHFGLIYQNVKESSLSKMCMEREDGFGALNYLDTSFISLLAAVGMEHETRLQKLERENMELRMEVEQLKNK